MDKRPALGKGLSALIPDVPEPAVRASTLEADIDRLSLRYSRRTFGNRLRARISALIVPERWYGWEGSSHWP